jgi:hypothetical protein
MLMPVPASHPVSFFRQSSGQFVACAKVGFPDQLECVEGLFLTT